MTSKELEVVYRTKIKKWFEDLHRIPLCAKLLDAVSQCEDLKFIFDFESESVSIISSHCM